MPPDIDALRERFARVGGYSDKQVDEMMATAQARMHASKHAHTHACTQARMHARTHACTRACTHAHTHARTHTHAHTHAHIHVCMHAHTHAFTQLRLRAFNTRQSCELHAFTASTKSSKVAVRSFFCSLNSARIAGLRRSGEPGSRSLPRCRGC